MTAAGTWLEDSAERDDAAEDHHIGAIARTIEHLSNAWCGRMVTHDPESGIYRVHEEKEYAA